jgi:hypothetical protein
MNPTEIYVMLIPHVGRNIYWGGLQVTANSVNHPGEPQARRLESVYEQLRTLLIHSDAIRRLRAAGDKEWSVTQVLGHLVEMIPYWLGHCRVLIAATGEPPVFGRGPDAPERLAGIKRGSNGNPKELLGLLNDEVKAATRAIREMSAAERSKKGIHVKLGELTVADSVDRFIVAHAEEHLEQIRAALLG